MIGFNPTPELRELLTHHHRRHKSNHIHTKLKLQIKSKLTQKRHCRYFSSRNCSLRVETTASPLNSENLKLNLKIAPLK